MLDCFANGQRHFCGHKSTLFVLSCPIFPKKMHKKRLFAFFSPKMFAYIKKKQYLCSRFWEKQLV